MTESIYINNTNRAITVAIPQRSQTVLPHERIIIDDSIECDTTGLTPVYDNDDPGMTDGPQDMTKAMQQVARFAEVWAAEITEAFKPFTAAVNQWAEQVKLNQMTTEHVYIVKSQIADGDIWGVYTDRTTAQRQVDEAEAEMNDDNYQHLVVEEWDGGTRTEWMTAAQRLAAIRDVLRTWSADTQSHLPAQVIVDIEALLDGWQ